jgi:hypothetical protein
MDSFTVTCVVVVSVYGTRTLGVKLGLLNPVALVSKRTIPTERPPLVGEVSANFCG